eukprot:scaffold299721_cov48-Prasinocladus_malaysianus.AAC.1
MAGASCLVLKLGPNHLLTGLLMLGPALGWRRVYWRGLAQLRSIDVCGHLDRIRDSAFQPVDDRHLLFSQGKCERVLESHDCGLRRVSQVVHGDGGRHASLEGPPDTQGNNVLLRPQRQSPERWVRGYWASLSDIALHPKTPGWTQRHRV